ncbi:NAD(P)/FAD-dependent oxidoreductase [Pelagibius sp.]|uniref:FAD/NAD(P)-dependent oxidoreductase n=1 Tax=Pelagibius sp. TaxID=1931238 RepID=UPI003BB07C17
MTQAQVQVVVVGAGPAGLSAVQRLARRGVRSVLVDDNLDAGGQTWRAGPGSLADAAGTKARAALHARSALVDHRAVHEVVALFPPRKLWVVTHDGSHQELEPDVLILAPGALEVHIPVPGWTLPGVYGVGAIQALAKGTGVVPKGPVVIAGAGPLIRLVAAQLADAGTEVVAVVDAAGPPGPRTLAAMSTAPRLLARGIRFERALQRHGIPLFRRHAISRIEGDGRAEHVLLTRLDNAWSPVAGEERRIAASTVGLGFGVRPNLELALLAGCAHRYLPLYGGWVPERDDHFETTVPGVFVVGDGGGIEGVESADAQGLIAAEAVADRLGAVPGDPAPVAAARRRRARLQRFRKGLAEWSNPQPGLYGLCQADTIVCRCEDVTAGEITRAAEWGGATAHVVKMATRAGMGLCQGRTCAAAVQALIARAGGVSPQDLVPPSRRPPLRPTALGSLIGRSATGNAALYRKETP